MKRELPVLQKAANKAFTAFKWGAIPAAVLTGLWYGGSALIDAAQAPTELDELKKLEAVDSLVDDGAEYVIVGNNAIRVIYGWGHWFLFDMDDKTIVDDNNAPKNELDKSLGMISFDAFNNPAIIERVRINGCKISRDQILPHPDTSEYRVEQRTNLKNWAAHFSDRHCPNPS